VHCGEATRRGAGAGCAGAAAGLIDQQITAVPEKSIFNSSTAVRIAGASDKTPDTDRLATIPDLYTPQDGSDSAPVWSARAVSSFCLPTSTF
jgi:hypothetical protein